MDTGDCGRENPISFPVHRESDSVLITIKKMTTLRGSPWHTPLLRGTGSVKHSSVEKVAERSVYHERIHLQNSGGA